MSGESLGTVAPSFAAPLALLCAVIVMGLLVWLVVRRRVPVLRGWGAGLALAALVLGGPAYGAMESSGPALADFASDRALPARDGASFRPLTPDAGAAMAWIERNTPHDAVVATNRHCVVGRAGCVYLAFWVSGLGGRRTVLEGWGYTSSAVSWRAPAPFPERLAVNDAVFTHPSVKTIERLRQEYGASWLVADTLAGPLSPEAMAGPPSSELARHAVPRFRSGEVTVYELR